MRNKNTEEIIVKIDYQERRKRKNFRKHIKIRWDFEFP